MRGHLNYLGAAVFVFVFTAAAVAQDTPEKPAPEQNRQEKDNHEKSNGNSRPGTTRPDTTRSRSSNITNQRTINSLRNGPLEDKLSKQLRIQGILPQDEELQAVCSDFRDLSSCIAVLRLSVSVPVEFTCLKWNVTGVKPKAAADSCAGPPAGKAMSLDRALDLLKPKLNGRAEAQTALKRAHDDIKDASS